jgi:tripartite-type tricarboxylate transporter receptor subunit TctC
LFSRRLLLTGLGWAAAQSVAAFGPYPDRALTLIVPFPPGGVTDIVARPLAEALARELRQTVIVENKSGAGGALGTGQAARAAADGYTLLMSLPSVYLLPHGDDGAARRSTSAAGLFKPVARLTAEPPVLVVRADSPWKTLADFLADARQRPGALNYGSSGQLSSMHVPMEMLAASAGLSMLHIPYAGANAALLGLLGGQVDAVASGPSTVAQQVRAGKLRALAHWGDQALVALPEVPSLRQGGVKLSFVQWAALFVPAGTPEDVLLALRAAVRRAAAQPALASALSRAGTRLDYLDGPDFQPLWDADSRRLAEAVRQIGKRD